jgi:hypothetical protein
MKQRLIDPPKLTRTDEEVASSKEQKFLCKAVDEVERSLMYIDVSSDGLSHLVGLSKSAGGSSMGEA